MAFFYKYFLADGSQNLLAEYNIKQDTSTGRVDSSLIQTSNGHSIDYLGSTRRLPRGQQIVVRGTYAEEVSLIDDETGDLIVDEKGNTLATGNGGDTLRAQTEQIRAQIGKLGNLQRQGYEDNALTYKDARLMHVKSEANYKDGRSYSQLDLTFEVSQTKWRSFSQTVTSGTLIASLNLFTVDSIGTESVEDAEIIITPTGGALTSILIELNDSSFTWSGNLAVGKDLVINCGKSQIFANGIDAYNGLTLNNNHVSASWLVLRNESNEIDITPDVACNITVRHFDQWM